MGTPVKIDIGNTAYGNINDVSTRDGISPVLIDGFKNDVGSDVKRPGLSLEVDLGTSASIDGVYWSDHLRLLIAVSNGQIFKVANDGTATELTGATLEKGVRVSFTEDGTRIFMANGGRIAYTNGTIAGTSMISDPDAPTTVWGLDYLDTFLFASTDTNMQYSSAGNALSWAATDSETAGSKWDNIQTIAINYREITLFGNDTVDVYQQDSGTIARLSGAYTESGTASRWSMKFFNNAYHYINQDKRLIRLEGRNPRVVSTPYDKQIQSFGSVEDVIGDVINIAGRSFYILHFPANNITLAWDYELGLWYQWGNWNILTGLYDRWRGNCHTFSHVRNKHYVGDHSNGKLYLMSEDYYDDAGDAIRFFRRTGHISHGTSRYKRSNEIVFTIDRGHTEVTSPRMMLRWQNNGKQAWGNWKYLSLGSAGDHSHYIHKGGNGRYRSRQYEIAHTDATPFELINPIDEDVDIMSK